MDLPLVEVARLDDPAFYAGETASAFARLRREQPVFWYEPGEFWAISKYEDIRFVSSHPDLFSSRYGIIPSESSPLDDGSEVEATDMPRRALLRRRLHMAKAGPGTEYLVVEDPPRHTVLRKLVSYAFTPRTVASLQSDVLQLTTQALDGVEPGCIEDFVEALAAPVPLYVIGQMLGVPPEDRDKFRLWSDAGILTMDVDDAGAAETTMQHLIEFYLYFSAKLAERRLDPQDDLLTALATAEVDGEQLSEQNQVVALYVLLFAGNETTRSFISGSAKLLAENPSQRSLLVAHPELIDSALAELLRLVTPVATFCRTAVEDVELRDHKIRKGDFVVMLHGAGNRDEEIWEHADELDVTRPTDPAHLAFGFGEHYCLGASLARQEGRIVLRELLKRFPSYELAGPVVRYPSTMIPGIREMPVLFR